MIKSLSNRINRHSYRIMMALLMAVMLFYAVWRIAQIENENLQMMMGVILCVYFLVLIIAWFVLKKGKKGFEIYLTAAFLFIALVYAAVFLPGTVPDELTHYLCAYRWSNLFSVKQAAPTMRLEDATFISEKISSSLNYDHFVSVVEHFSVFSKENALVAWPSDLSLPSLLITNSPLGYIGSGLGIAIGRMIGLSGIMTFYCGRLANILIFTVLLYFSIKKLPYGKLAFFAIAALPMTLHVVASYSYDFLSVGFSLFFVAQILSFRAHDGSISKKEMILCGITGVVLSISKVVYVFILFLVLLIPKSKFAHKKQALLFKGLVIAAGCLAILLLQSTVIFTGIQSEAVAAADSGNVLYSTQWILTHPKASFIILLQTINFEKDLYPLSMIGQYLGWFEIELPFFCYGFFIFLLVFSFMKRDAERAAAFSFAEKLLMFLPALLSFGGVLYTLWISYTPLGYGYIYGVQGRYFIPLLPLIFLIVRNNAIEIKSKLDQGFLWLTLYWQMLTVVEIFALAVK